MNCVATSKPTLTSNSHWIKQLTYRTNWTKTSDSGITNVSINLFAKGIYWLSTWMNLTKKYSSRASRTKSSTWKSTSVSRTMCVLLTWSNAGMTWSKVKMMHCTLGFLPGRNCSKMNTSSSHVKSTRRMHFQIVRCKQNTALKRKWPTSLCS